MPHVCSVGFGNNGEWKDHPDGSFECLEAPK